MVIKVRFPRKFWFFVRLCKFFFFWFLLRFWSVRKGWIVNWVFYSDGIALFWIDGLCLVAEKTLNLKNWSAFYGKRKLILYFTSKWKYAFFFFFKERNGWEFDFSFCFVWSLKIRDDTDSFLKNYWLLRKCWKSVQFEEL